MHTKFLICAAKIIWDKHTNKLSAIEIVDDFVSNVFPMAFPEFYVLWYLGKDVGENDNYVGKISIKLNNVNVGEFDVNIAFQGVNSTRAILGIGGLALPNPGILTISAAIPGYAALPESSYSVNVGNVVQAAQPNPN